jgi:hypothetical protein
MTPEKKEAENKEVKEISTDDLAEVAGGESPFEDVPRVPVKPIDDKLRNNG